MKLEMMSLSLIVPYETNAKKHPKYQIQQIKESIETFRQ
ncbi:DNA methylase [Streptococcus dysgalactiae]|nr:DNA methylase [Streptococcus dysgalactiae]